MKKKLEQTELPHIELPVKNDVNKNKEVTNKKQKKKLNPKEIINNILTFFTVEPFLLCYILPSIISSLAVQKLNLEKACRSDLNHTEETCHKIITGAFDENDTIASEASGLAQVLVAEMTAWRQPLQSGLPAIVILFVGSWSDRTGNRKALMLIPLIGEIISGIGMILTTYYFLEWPLWVTGLIEALPPALTGGWSIALMGSYSYIADVTSIDSRTFRIGIVAIIVTLGIPIGSAISGVLTEAVGYYGIFGIGLLFYTIGFIHTFFRIHDVRTDESTCDIISFFHPKNIIGTLSILVKGNRLKIIQIWLVIWAQIVIVGPVYGEGALVYLYTLLRYSMDLVEFSLYSTYSVIMGLIGTLIAVTIFSKLLKMHDSLIGVISTACKVMSSVLYALAPTKKWFYVGPAVDFFGNVGVTAIRSLGTKIVEPDEVGKMCSIIGLAEAIVPVVYTPLYSIVYSKTLDTFPGTFYMLGAAMTVPAFFIFMYMYFLYKRSERDVVRNPKEKEFYARDNEITSL